MNVQEFLERTLRLVRVLASGENMTASEGQDGLNAFNEMLGSWSNEGFNIYQSVREEFDFVSGQDSYTMGVGGNFNSSKPQNVEAVSVLYSGSVPNQEYPLEVINLMQYQNIPAKSVESTISQFVYMEEQASTVTFKFYPTPTNGKAVIYSRKRLAPYTGLTDVITLPEGYTRALRYNLAVELAIEYGKQLDQMIIVTAQDLKSAIQRKNSGEIKSVSDAYGIANKAPYNIYTRGF